MLHLDASTRILPSEYNDVWTYGPYVPAQDPSGLIITHESHRSLFRRLADRAKECVESPWSPPAECIPRKRSVEESGNSPDPFRTLAFTGLSTKERSRSLALTQNSEERSKISEWSDLYKYTIHHHRLPPELEGTTILHLSDIHLFRNDDRPIRELRALRDYLTRTDTRIDLLFFTGDLITKLPDDLSLEAQEVLKDLTDRAALSLSVLGNHDFHGEDPQHISRFLERAGFTDLTNSETSLSIGGAALNIIGVDDALFGSPRAPSSISSTGFNIAIGHNQNAFRANFPQEVDLILTGHTHWGEFKLPGRHLLSALDGMSWMQWWGYADNVNGHTQGWDQLNDRALAFVSPGLARHYAPHRLAFRPGFVLHTLSALS